MTQLDLAPARPAAVPAGARRRPQPRLRVVSGAQVRTRYTGFGLLCAVLLGLGLLALLLLNTARAEQSFTVADLQRSSSSLGDDESQLRSELSALSAPEQVALKAQAMGLVPGGRAGFVRASDGAVLGAAEPAVAGTPFTVNTLPDTPARSVASRAVSAADTGVEVQAPPSPAAPASAAPTAPTAAPGAPAAAPTPGRPAQAAGGAAATSAPSGAETPTPPAPSAAGPARD